MTTVDTHPLHIAPAIEYYEENAGLHNSPLMQPQRVSLLPSPSPPPNVPLPPASPESSPGPDGRKGSGRQKKYRPSQGDAVLVSFMGGGRYTDVARGAGDKPLASGDEDLESPVMEGTAVEIEGTKIELLVVQESEKDMENDETKEARIAENHAALAALAMNAMKKAQTSNEAAALKVITPNSSTSKQDAPPPPPPPPPPAIGAMEGLKPPIHSLANLYVAASPDSDSNIIELERVTSPAGELPPIRQQSPQSAKSIGSGAHHITLPSITAQLGYINHLTEAPPAPESVFAQSPPGSRPLPRFSAVPGHGSPPKSPNDAFRRELPSPGRNQFYPYPSSHRRPSTAEGLPSFASAPEYSSSTADTPSTDNSGAIPATMGIDRMSIDGITNPQIGGFQCIYHGCTAQPFQTQYLLNSHANVHSSNRPHYCIVKGCPRSEGGKGFKRKNEMIRHGLVHDSPGYVCPFCPDREHKYPRPDNLQRHVRVHHVDKDKDDPQLREVLSQRPEGPSRGRRRRGGTS